MNVKYLLIGGGLASHNAAKAIREADSQGSIAIVGQENHRPYNRPPLSKELMQGKILPETVFLERPDFYEQQKVDLLLGQTVGRLDAAGKTAELRDGQKVGFEKALLAMGGRPVRLSIPGANLSGVYYLRTLDDCVAISNRAAEGMRVAIVGGGFIGLELAASLTQRGLRATVIQGGPHIWSRFADAKLAAYFEEYCAARGVMFISNEKPQAIQGDAAPTAVVTSSGRTVPCNMVVIAVGIVPNVELAQEAGLKVDNGVGVDSRLRSSNPDIYAAGDLCNYPDPYSNRRRRVEHWGQADYTGTLAGQNMAGADKPYDLLTYVFSDIFDLHLEFAGDEHQYDRMLIRGRMEGNSFAVLYLKQNVLTAHFSVNLKRKQYAPLQKLIEQKVDVAGRDAQLQDAGFDVLDLLPQPQKT